MSEFDSTNFQRSAHSTRERIIAAAARHFARKPLRSVPLKEIASDAGVSAPLIIKHFGSKEGLMAELIDFSQFKGTLSRAPFNELGQRMASAILTGQGMAGQSMIPLIVGSLDSEETAKVIAERFNEAIADDLIHRVEEDGPEDISHGTAVYRSQMVVSLCVGYLVLSDTGLIDEANAPKISVEALGSCLQQIIEHG